MSATVINSSNIVFGAIVLPCTVLRLYFLQDVQSCEVEGEHKQIG